MRLNEIASIAAVYEYMRKNLEAWVSELVASRG